jgi:hypothetical protein
VTSLIIAKIGIASGMYLIDCTIASFTQLHARMEILGGGFKFSISKDCGLDIIFFKSYKTKKKTNHTW